MKVAIELLNKYKRSIAALILCLSLAAGGCQGNISERTLPSDTAAPVSEPVSETTTTTKKTSIATVKITTTTAATTLPEETEETTEPIIEDYNSFVFSDEYNDFLSDCVFVGDSICSGLKLYEILPSKNVVAQGNVAARNISERRSFPYSPLSLTLSRNM